MMPVKASSGSSEEVEAISPEEGARARGQVRCRTRTDALVPQPETGKINCVRPPVATVLGDVAYGKDGEWAATRTLFTQFQNVAPNDLEQFRTSGQRITSRATRPGMTDER